MKVRVLAFATAADALGAAARDWEVADGATLGALAADLAARFPALGRHAERLAWAVDGELSRPERELTEGAEVALLPPVSGG